MKTAFALPLLLAAICPTVMFGQDPGKPIRVFEGHTDKVTCVAISPNGKFLLSGSDDRTIRLWDLESGKTLQVFKEHQNYVLSVVFSRDGKRFLSAGGGQWRGPKFATETDQVIRLWDIGDSKVLKKMTGHEAPVWSVALSPDGIHALSGSGGYDYKADKAIPAGHSLRLWNLGSGETVREFKGHDSWIRSVAFHPDGKKIVSGSWDKTVRIWDIEKDMAVRVLRDHKDHINAVAISNDGKWILSGGGPTRGNGDTAIRLWDFEKDDALQTYAGHTQRIWKIAFAKDGKHFLSAAADSTIRLWDISKGKAIHVFTGHTDEVRQAIFTPDGTHVISASHDKTVRLWLVP